MAKLDHCPECGCVLHDGEKPRSPEQHRRFFAVCAAAYHNWPESHERQFADAEDCRKWLQMKAGWRVVGSSIPLSDTTPDEAVLLAKAAIAGAGAYAQPVIHNGHLVVWRPKSIKWNKMGHEEFCALNNAVDDVIHEIFGMDGDELLNHHSEAA